MRRVRLSTMLLLMVIAALSLAVAIQTRRADRLEARQLLMNRMHNTSPDQVEFLKHVDVAAPAQVDELFQPPARKGR